MIEGQRGVDFLPLFFSFQVSVWFFVTRHSASSLASCCSCLAAALPCLFRGSSLSIAPQPTARYRGRCSEEVHVTHTTTTATSLSAERNTLLPRTDRQTHTHTRTHTHTHTRTHKAARVVRGHARHLLPSLVLYKKERICKCRQRRRVPPGRRRTPPCLAPWVTRSPPTFSTYERL